MRRDVHDARSLAPCDSRADGQLERHDVAFAEAGRHELDLALPYALRLRAEEEVCRTVLRQRERPRRALDLDFARRLDDIARFAVRSAPVRKRQRNLELVSGRDKARRVRLHDELGRHLAKDGLGTGRLPGADNGCHAHLSHELGKTERCGRAAVRKRNVRLPRRERLEAPRWHGADAAKHLRAEAAACLDSAGL